MSPHRRDPAVVQVEIGPADRRRRDLHDRVLIHEDLRVRDVAGYDWPPGAAVCDVAGGVGTLLAAILCPVPTCGALHMLTQCDDGRQRPAEELRMLLEDAGLRPGAVKLTSGPALLEGPA